MWFFFIFISVLLLIYLYPSRRIIPSLLKPPVSTAVWLLLLTSLLLLVGHMFMRRQGNFIYLTELSGQIGFSMLGFMTLLFCMVLIRDTCFLLFRTGTFLNNRLRKAQKPVDLQKRALLIRSSNMAMLGLGAAASAYGYKQAKQTPEVVRMQISLNNLHRDLKGLTIVQLTDIHVGATIKRDFIHQLVLQCQKLQPDIIVLTGDLADGQAFLLRDEIQEFGVLHPPLGKFFVTGNHEYYSDLDGWLKEVEKLGFDILLNEHRNIIRGDGALTLAGVTDYRAGSIIPSHQSDPQKALAGCNPENPKILLAHQPKSVYQAAEFGINFQISGHTHGGQYIPGNFFVPMDQPFVAGLYTYKNTQLYVSKGTGYWGPPLRLGISSEITLFTLA